MIVVDDDDDDEEPLEATREGDVVVGRFEGKSVGKLVGKFVGKFVGEVDGEVVSRAPARTLQGGPNASQNRSPWSIVPLQQRLFPPD